jgi:ketosteroid isomerase-like protein
MRQAGSPTLAMSHKINLYEHRCEIAYVVQMERLKAKVGGREEITPYALRATMIFRPEDGVWKVVHRHADPIITAQPAESVIQD